MRVWVDGGSFIVRPEWQFILPARRTEGTSPSDINDAASREDLPRNSTGARQKGWKGVGGRGKEENLPSPCKRRGVCRVHFQFLSYIKGSARSSWLMTSKMYSQFLKMS